MRCGRGRVGGWATDGGVAFAFISCSFALQNRQSASFFRRLCPQAHRRITMSLGLLGLAAVGEEALEVAAERLGWFG